VTFHGRCHCGQLRVDFHSDKSPAELGSRACTCTFCAPRRIRWTSDPAGRVEIAAASEAGLSRYRFGTGTAVMLVCRDCGFAVAALSDDGPRAVVAIDVLERADEFREATRNDLEGEALADRLARRARSWTPAVLTVKS
jgi:hypothetical protein